MTQTSRTSRASWLLLTALLAVSPALPCASPVDDGAAMVQTHLGHLASPSRASDDEQSNWAELKELVITVFGKMSNKEDGACTKCQETSFEVMCRGKSLRFAFRPSTPMARVVNKFPRKNMGWSPEKDVYHNLTVILRRSGNHTFYVTDGQNSALTWSKDFKRMKMFPRDQMEIEGCKYFTTKKKKDLSKGKKKCYSAKKFGQKHCFKMPEMPVLRNRDAPYQGTYPDLKVSYSHCSAQGDPHYRTFEGVKYDYQGNGTHLMTSIVTPSCTLRAQVFNCPVPGTNRKGRRVSQGVAVAVAIGKQVVTYINDTTKVNGKVMDPGVYHSATLNLDICDDNVIVEGPKGPDGSFAEIRVNKREVKKSAVGYVFGVVAQVPADSVANSTGLCKPRVQGPQQFISRDSPDNLFTEEELQLLDDLCCPETGCNGPLITDAPEPPPNLEEACATADPPIPLVYAKGNCSDCETPEQCALDFCNSDGDLETVLDCGALEVDDEVPEEPVVVPQPPRAVDDPHCRNVRGESFDIHAVGLLDMIRVPVSGPQDGRDLWVKASIDPISQHPCAPTVITQLEVVGDWLALPDVLRITPGQDGVPAVAEAWQQWMESPQASNANMTLQFVKWRSGTMTMLELVVRGVQMTIHQRRGKVSGVDYLDLETKNLDLLKEAAGGLLGVDAHDREALPRKGCDPRSPPIHLAQATDSEELLEGLWREDEEEMEEDERGEIGRLLSRAWVIRT